MLQSKIFVISRLKFNYLQPLFRLRNISDPVLLDSGEDAIFECIFDANPIKYDGIHWLRHDKESDEEVIVSDGSRRVSIDWDDISGNIVKTRLVVRNVTVQDAGRIFCVFSNGYGKETRGETYLLVKRKYLHQSFQFPFPFGNDKLI